MQFGTKITDPEPGSAQGLYLVVPDVQAVRGELASHGVASSEVFHPSAPRGQFRPLSDEGRAPGRVEGEANYSTFATIDDLDGNTWLLQEVTSRLPGRNDATATTFATVHDLEVAMTRASVAHGEHEARNGGEYDQQWPAWYAAFMARSSTATSFRSSPREAATRSGRRVPAIRLPGRPVRQGKAGARGCGVPRRRRSARSRW